MRARAESIVAVLTIYDGDRSHELQNGTIARVVFVDDNFSARKVVNYVPANITMYTLTSMMIIS